MSEGAVAQRWLRKVGEKGRIEEMTTEKEET